MDFDGAKTIVPAQTGTSVDECGERVGLRQATPIKNGFIA